MEEPQSLPTPQDSQPVQPSSVMDVAPPRPSAETPPAAPPVAVAPPDENHPKSPLPDLSADQKTPPKPKLPAKPKSGLAAVISATVIIVIVLAALAVYAYLKQNK